MSNTAISERREPPQQGNRVLRVYEGFGKPPVDSLSWFIGNMAGNTKQNEAIADLFRANGFHIVEGGNFNTSNSLEFSISDDSQVNEHIRDLEVARKVGIDMPRFFAPEEAISVSGPLVAKLPGSARGEDKFILKNKDQKTKFIAWALMNQNLGDLYDQKNRDEIVQRILSKVSEGDFKDPFIDERGWLDSWLFEEYINPPGEYNTSFRVVADALGDVIYSQVARSDAQKEAERLPTPETHYPVLEQISIPGNSFFLLLLHPDSPFYISPTKFFSNVASGGKPLLLNGKPVVDQLDRKILEDLDINPDEPELPQQLSETTSAIGREYRRYFPHVGVDFMKRSDNGKFVLLEVNKGPNLRPEALGLPAETPPEQSELELLRRIIAKLPS
jgi:hypothetical protein